MIRDWAVTTNEGGRVHNEDTVEVLCEENKILAVAADGLGGCGGGEIASASAADYLKSSLWKMPCTKEAAAEAVSGANCAVLARQHGEVRMKTTLAVLYGAGDRFIAAHVGDTRIYQFRGGKIIFQTRDHSVSQMAVYMGEITQAEIRGHADRNKLIRVLGNSSGVKAEIHEPDWQKGDVFLLCTDGFWEMISEEEMSLFLLEASDMNRWLQAMESVIRKRMPKESDNYSAAAVRI